MDVLALECVNYETLFCNYVIKHNQKLSSLCNINDKSDEKVWCLLYAS